MSQLLKSLKPLCHKGEPAILATDNVTLPNFGRSLKLWKKPDTRIRGNHRLKKSLAPLKILKNFRKISDFAVISIGGYLYGKAKAN